MVLEQKLGLRLTQKLMITPQLQQAIKLLQYHKLELQNVINQELVENPMLEEVLVEPGEPADAEAEAPPDAETPAERDEEQEVHMKDRVDNFDYEQFFRDMDDPYPRSSLPREVPELLQTENFLAHEVTLHEHLLWQLGEITTAEETQNVARAIIGNLNNNGYLNATTEEIMAMGGWSETATVEALRVVQGLDPAGVGARDLQECLLIQLRHLELLDTPAEVIVIEHLELLRKHRYDDISRKIGISVEMVKRWIDIIKDLNPTPGLKHSLERSFYVAPDVYVVKMEGEYVILLNDEGLPRLRINPAYRKLMLSKDANSNPETKTFITEKLKSALWLIRSLEQRQRTIFKVSESIVKHQIEFLDRGIDHIKPLVLRNIADDIGMHESTVSRVITKKYMHTPQGLFQMKYFFHSGIQCTTGQDISSLTVKEKIRKIVDEEDSAQPISDSVIVKHLRTHGLDIARRTVAKYREEMRIPSSTYRKNNG